MLIPNTNCCRCFAKITPGETFTRKFTEMAGNTKATRRVTLPMCKTCREHAQIRSIVEPILSWTIVGLAVLVSCACFLLLLERLDNVGVIMISFFVALILALIIGFFIHEFVMKVLLGKDYIEQAHIMGIVSIRFANKDFQALCTTMSHVRMHQLNAELSAIQSNYPAKK